MKLESINLSSIEYVRRLGKLNTYTKPIVTYSPEKCQKLIFLTMINCICIKIAKLLK